MTQEDALPEITWPRWEWVLDRRGFSVSSIFGVLSFFAAFLIEAIPTWIWISVGTVLVLLWLLVPLVLYARRAYQAVRARYRQYPIARDYARRKDRELEQAQRRVSEILPYVSVFQLKNVLYETVEPGTPEIYIVVEKTNEVRLEVGDKLQVIDERDEKLMGVFEVRREREQDYFALGMEVDANWAGLVHQEGRREQYPPVNAVARLVRRSR